MSYTPIISWPVLLPVAAGLLVVCVVAAARGGGVVRWVRRALMVLAVVAVAAGPTAGSMPARAQLSNLDVVIAIDTTPSVNAMDWDGHQPRLTGVRTDVDALVQALDGARVDVVTFSSQAVEALPFSTDPDAVHTLLSVTEPENDSNSAGSTLSRPVTLLHTVLARDAAAFPERRRLLVLTSDGEQTDGSQPGSFASLRPYLSGGAVWGYGTTAGARMYSYDPDDPTGHELVEGPDGSPAVSRYDPATLRAAAAQLGVPFHHRIAPGGVSSAVALPHSSPSSGTAAAMVGIPRYWIPALPLAALALWEAWSLAAGAAPRRIR